MPTSEAVMPRAGLLRSITAKTAEEKNVLVSPREKRSATLLSEAAAEELSAPPTEKTKAFSRKALTML